MPVLATWRRRLADATKAEKMEQVFTGFGNCCLFCGDILFYLWGHVGTPMGNNPNMRCKDQEEAEVEEKPEVTEVVEAGRALL